MKSRKGFLTRNALIEAALNRIAEQGVERLTIAAISEAIGHSRSSAYNHFPDLHAVLDGVLVQVLDKIGEMSGVYQTSKGNAVSVAERRIKFVLSLSATNPRYAKVLSELYRFHEPSVDAIESRLIDDINADILEQRVSLRQCDAPLFARIVVSSVMAILRMQDGSSARPNSGSSTLELLFGPVRRKD